MKHKLPTCVSPSSSKLRRLDGGCSQVEKTNSVNSLLNLSAKVVAEYLPFEYVERMLVHVPEPVQEKIIYFSFPQRDSDIYTYASFHTKYDKTRDKIPYYQGLEYFQNNCVEDVIQIGFHLTGSVRQQPASCVAGTQGNKFKVSITFDRCKIISVCCDCGNKGLPWCPHAVALAIFRIRQPQSVDYRSPISDALVCMTRSQLQKFAQYLIASHPNKILPSAQRLADQLLQPESTINKTSGAPDPTAGGSLQEVAAWYLDEAGVREQLRTELTHLASSSSSSSSSSNTTLVGGLYGGGGGQSGSSQLSGSNTAASASSVAMQRSNNSHRSHPSSSSSLDNNNSRGVVRNQSDADHNSSPTEEVGLDWLLRYRRLTSNQQNLFIGGTTCTNGGYTTLNDFDFPSLSSSSSSSNHGATASSSSFESSLLQSESSLANTNRVYYSTSPPFHLSNSFDIDRSVVHNHSNTTANGSNSSMQSSGTQIAAMFAKVRELLAKRDSNGPRLLSLITEELLNCSKLPPLKSRRNIRNSTINVPNRSQTIPVIRSPHSQLTSERNYSSENLSSSSSSNHTSSHLLFSQPPPWTTRLWEEVCLLWTLVILSPDCNAEAKKQWRYRLQNWARASRSPCDDCYLLPNHFFSSLHEFSDVDDDGLGQNQQQSGQQQPTRSYRRTSVFRLPIEVSYMSWDDVWLTHLLSFNNMKSDKNNEELSEDNMTTITSNRQNHHSTNISFPLDDSNSDCDNRIFRRPSSVVMTPRRANAHHNRLFQTNSPVGGGGGGECHCPYCDLSTSLTEPFPLLCLRVAALRSNGYLSQALQLAVFISQRLLRSVKAKTALAASTLINMVGMRSPPQTFSPHMSWNNNNNNSNNYYYPNDTLNARRTLFNTPPPNGQGIRLCTGGSLNSHNGMHSNSRYISSANMMPSSPSIISNHGKYSPSNRLTSPRPASLSPPVNNVSHHHTRSIPPPPPPRRLGLSPNSNHSPGPSCANHQSINNNNIGNSNNNNSWSSQSPYLFKSPPSTSQQYLNHCSPSSSSSSISPVPFHNSLNTNHVYLKPQQHMPYSNSPYSSACSLHTHNSNCGGSTINGNSTAMMHPVHYNNRALLTSPTPGGNRSLSARPLPSPGSGGGDSFPGVGGETDMMNCGLISPNCPCHTADIGWIGLPGRPVICLVECLLDAAAIVVEAANHHHQAPPIIALPAWGHMEKASFYLCLAVKVSLLALFQQRPPVGSVSRLLACQHQEARLLTLLNTIPKDVTIALAMCDTLCQLLGPPISSSRCLGRLDHSPVVRLWWWSALGFLVHPDTYPVHAVAEFVLNYLLDTQRLNQLSSFTTCWSGYANGSNNNNHMSSVRIDDMVFTLVIRAMRFSIPENYMMDTSATGPGLMRSNSSPQLSMGGGSSGGGVSQRTHYNYRGWGDHFNNGNNNNHLSGSSSGGHIIPAGVRSGLETALAVNTDQVSDQEFTSMTTPSMITSTAGGDPGNFDHHQRYSYLPTNNNNNNANPLFHWEHQHHQQSSAPEGGGDRFLMTTPKISSPPLPSAFAISTQNFLKSVNGTVNMNSPTSSSSSRNLCDHQAYVDNCRWSVPPVIMPSIDDHGGGEVVTPFSGLAPLFTIMRNNIRIRRNRFSSTILDDNHQTFNSTGSGNGIVPQNQNLQCRRCLDTLKIRQSRLAVALIRVSKSLIHRLDQIVQICDQNIDSPVTLLVISQQVFAEAFGWKLTATSLDRSKAPANDNTLHDISPYYSGCPCSHTTPTHHPNLIPPPNLATHSLEEVSYITRDRIHLLCTAFHLTLLAMIRTLSSSSRSCHWRRQEMLKWAVAIALHVGPFACLYLINHWSSYVNAKEAVIWLAPAILTAMGNLNSLPATTPSTKVLAGQSNPSTAILEDDICFDHSLFCGCSNCHGPSNNDPHMASSLSLGDRNCPMWSSMWHTFCPTPFTTIRNHTISISTAAQLLGTTVAYSKTSREQITHAVRHMAIQAAAKDPVSCSLPALHFSEEDSSAFETVYRLVLDAAEAGSIGPVQLFSLARYMDSHGWVWRAFPLALHATRLFVLSSTQEGHPVANDVLWACLLGHRLGPVALQEILKHVIHNIHCPTLLTDILHRCRTIPYGMNSISPVNSNVNHHHQHHHPINNNNCCCCTNNSNNINMSNNSNGTNNNTTNNNSNNYVHSSTIDQCVLMNNNQPTNSIHIGRNPCTTAHFCHASHYINNNNNSNNNANHHNSPIGVPVGTTSRLLSLDRPPLKGLLAAALNAFIKATHTRLSNISPRQYSEFVDFLTRARDTFHLLRPDGPLQFRQWVEFLRQTYRGKRKLVSLLSERFD